MSASRIVAAIVAVALAGAVPAQAQQKGGTKPKDTGVPNALQGFATNKDQPIQIEAASLEVRDKEKNAVFVGNVVVTQGDTVMKCKELRVFYDQDDPKGGAKGAPKSTMKAAQPGPGGRQSIRRLEARGGVIVTTKDQTATGHTGIFEMKTNTVTLSGDPVVITQGPNILKGERLVVDLTTSFARVEGKVTGLFSTGGKDDKPGGLLGPKETPKESPKETQKPAVKQKPTALPGPAVTN